MWLILFACYADSAMLYILVTLSENGGTLIPLIITVYIGKLTLVIKPQLHTISTTNSSPSNLSGHIVCLGKQVITKQAPLTHWGQDKMATIFQTFSNAFSWMKIYEFCIRFHWSLFLRFKLIIFQHCLVPTTWQGDEPLSELMIVNLLTHIYVSLSLNELITQ